MDEVDVAVVTHEADGLESRSYFLEGLVACWRDAGLRVAVLRGVDRFVPARVLFLHVDLSVVPEHYRLFARQYPVVVNGRVMDITKRHISHNLLTRNDSYAGPVIVKTDLNCGGVPEFERQGHGLMGWLQRKARKKLPWSITGFIPSSRYPVFPNVQSVPFFVWRNRHLVVEKFLPERDGDLYCTRHWLFFGNRELCYRVCAREPVVKAGNMVHRERGIPVPDQLRTYREELGFDYGKFDFTLHDGEVILFDANRTPTVATCSPGVRSDLAREFMAGLVPFLGRDFQELSGGGVS